MVFSICNDAAHRPLGFEFGAEHAGLKKSGELDLAWMRVVESPGMSTPSPAVSAVGFFSAEQPPSPAARLCRRHLVTSRGRVHALLVHAGNANCDNGTRGLADAESLIAKTATVAHLKKEQILICSSGVRGVVLPIEIIDVCLEALIERASSARALDFARAILSDGESIKIASATGSVDGSATSILGIAKAARRTHPRLATLLMLLFTDAALPQDLLQSLGQTVVDHTLHSMTIDGRSSPCDSFVIVANGASGGPLIQADSRSAAVLRVGLDAVAKNLVQQILREASSARVAQISVLSAPSCEEAHRVAELIAIDPQVKHSIATSSPDLDRILAALPQGDRDQVSRITLLVDGVSLIRNGQRMQPAAEVLARVFIRDRALVQLDLGLGAQQAHLWTATYPFRPEPE